MSAKSRYPTNRKRSHGHLPKPTPRGRLGAMSTEETDHSRCTPVGDVAFFGSVFEEDGPGICPVPGCGAEMKFTGEVISVAEAEAEGWRDGYVKIDGVWMPPPRTRP